MSDRDELGKTICASCRDGKLVSTTMWDGTARYWYCAKCGWINRWVGIQKPEQTK